MSLDLHKTGGFPEVCYYMYMPTTETWEHLANQLDQFGKEMESGRDGCGGHDHYQKPGIRELSLPSSKMHFLQHPTQRNKPLSIFVLSPRAT